MNSTVAKKSLTIRGDPVDGDGREDQAGAASEVDDGQDARGLGPRARSILFAGNERMGAHHSATEHPATDSFRKNQEH